MTDVRVSRGRLRCVPRVRISRGGWHRMSRMRISRRCWHGVARVWVHGFGDGRLWGWLVLVVRVPVLRGGDTSGQYKRGRD